MTYRATSIDPEFAKFGEKVNAILAERKISRNAFANKTGISLPTIDRICQCRQLPTIKLAVEIARHLDISIDEIFDLQEK